MSRQQVSFSSLDRAELLHKALETRYELLVVGGGATGCGIALDAASRGISTILFEKGDFASGTSSKSTKLIHGGLRYLKQLEIGLVRESGLERAVVNRIAPHLCIPEKMLLPLTEEGSFGKHSTSLALWVYDFLAKVEEEDQRKMLSREETLAKEPLLKKEGLKGSGYYAEYRTDDARLTIELIKKAAYYGATAFNYIEVIDFMYEEGRIVGVVAYDHLATEEIKVRAKHVVSAGGPWVDSLRQKNNSITDKRLHLTKGVHIVVPFEKLPLSQCVYFDIEDGRMAFAIPRGRITYIGTTDTTYTGDKDRIVATKADRLYLINAANAVFNSQDLLESDVISNWAGLRPLIHEDGKSPSELSRKDEIFEAKDGLISIAGGKLTGYRKMAERVVDKVVRLLSKEGIEYGDSSTEEIFLTPSLIADNDAVEDYIEELSMRVKSLGLDVYYAWYLVTNYGTQAEDILEILDNHEDKSETTLALAEVEFCINHEMVQTAADFLVRRTGRLYFDILTIAPIRNAVMQYLSQKLAWSQERVRSENSRLDVILTDATTYYDNEMQVPTA